ncbi:MAG: hypothetical protein NTW87_01630, partial [Planctomycetota bacterium]|nr:hypothetical protein [Planctomycetota bacterium]
MSWRAYLAIGLCVVLVGGAIVLVRRNALAPSAPGSAQQETPGTAAPPGPTAGPATGAPNAKNPLYIGQVSTQSPRQVHTVLTTRQGETTYQALVRYTPRSAPMSDVPGLSEVLQVLAQRNQQLPQYVVRVDQETEMLKDNLGELLRSVSSTHYYMSPASGQVIAYDVANSAGGQPQRFVGHITRTGVKVEVFRGAEQVDRHEIPFQGRDTFIPVEVEFIHQWYQANPDALRKNEPVSFWVFIPDVMLSLMLAARPLGDQVIPVKDKTYECARYEVVTVSTQSAEGLYGRQQMWFDKRSGLLMKRDDFDPGFGPGEAPVTERGTLESLAQVRALAVRAPPLPDKPFPYQLDQDLVYSVRIAEKELGSLRFKFSRAPDAADEHVAMATVNLDGSNGSRHENAVTRFDHNWQPLSYLVSGDEAADAKATYKIDAKLGRGTIEANIQRQVEQPAAPPPDAGRPAGAPGDAADRATPPAEAANTDADGWKDPLRRVPVTDEESKAQETSARPRLNTQRI